MTGAAGVEVAPIELALDGVDPPKEPALLGNVVRPVPRVVVARGRLLEREYELGGGSLVAIGIVAAGPPTVRLLTTVFTPPTAAASFAAAMRSVSLATVPFKVTVPLVAFTAIPLLVITESVLIFACTSLAISVSEREALLPVWLHPAATSANNTKSMQREFFIVICRPLFE